MIYALWGVIAALAVLTGLTWLVLLGIMRALDDLQGNKTSPHHLRDRPQGLGVGSLSPAFTGPTVDGALFSSVEVRDTSLLIVFVHPGCSPCEALVPQIFMVFAAFRLPGTTVLVSRGSPGDQPAGWRKPLHANESRLEIVLEKEDEISQAFRVDARPFAYFIGPDQTIKAARVINNADDVLALTGGSMRSQDKTTIPAGVI